jgi:hypothetical protein
MLPGDFPQYSELQAPLLDISPLQTGSADETHTRAEDPPVTGAILAHSHASVYHQTSEVN